MEWAPWVRSHRKTPALRKTDLVLTEKYARDIVWSQNFAPVLLESIMKPTHLAKEEVTEDFGEHESI